MDKIRFLARRYVSPRPIGCLTACCEELAVDRGDEVLIAVRAVKMGNAA